MKSRLLITAALAGALGVSACASGPTPYQPASTAERGYSDTRIEENRYRVSFKGNTLTNKETVENYLLYRAAELTLQLGYDHFTVVTRGTEGQSELRSSGTSFHSRWDYTYWHPRYGWIGPYWDNWGPDTYREVTRYEASAEVVMGKGPKDENDVNAFDARDVAKNLAGQISRPEQ